MERVAVANLEKQGVVAGLVKNFIHEIFLYTVACYLKNEDYKAAGHILGRTYYNPNKYKEKISGYDLFYSGRYDSLDRAMKERDKKDYISGTAAYWIENIDTTHYTKKHFLLADLICYNYSIYGKDNLFGSCWFPMTYIYDNEYSSVLGILGRKFVSREFMTRILPLFGFDTVDEFGLKIDEITKKFRNGEYREIRYPYVLDEAPILSEFVDQEQMATVR